MRKHNFLKAVATVLCMALLISGTAFAATPGQALDAKEVKYGTLSRADQNILKSMFNAEEYAAMNEDVVKAVGKDTNKLFAHFIKYGVFEGRGPSKSFNVSAYMSSYGDLQKAFGKDIMAYYRHYNNYGKKEKRELVTVEKAEAAGVVIKSVTGATKTVLTPAQEEGNKSSGGSSTESSSSSPVVIVANVWFFNPPAVSGGDPSDLGSVTKNTTYSTDWVTAMTTGSGAPYSAVTYGLKTVLVYKDNSTLWSAYLSANPEFFVTLDANGGSGTEAKMTCSKGDVIASAPTCPYTAPTDKVFDKWQKEGADVTFPLTVNSAITLTAVWKDAPVTTYTVTYPTDTNVNSSNVITQFAAGEPFSATLSAASGYTLGTVTVTMGGTDITATAYSAPTVTISAITGNVVITATATASGGGAPAHSYAITGGNTVTIPATLTLSLTDNSSAAAGNITWEVAGGTGTASIGEDTGVLTPLTAGTVTVTAKVGGTPVVDDYEVTISAGTITITSASTASIATGTLSLTADVAGVTWAIVDGGTSDDCSIAGDVLSVSSGTSGETVKVKASKTGYDDAVVTITLAD